MNRFAATLACCAVALPGTTTAAAPCESEAAKVTAQFAGARMSSCAISAGDITIAILPEDEKINPSPWYAFHVAPKTNAALTITLTYPSGKHRYPPKISTDGKAWTPLPGAQVQIADDRKSAVLTLSEMSAPFYISAQEFVRGADYQRWMAAMAQDLDVDMHGIGHSVEGRPITALRSAPEIKEGRKEYAVFVGRQHPPEVTGARAMLPFMERVYGDSAQAIAFRRRFHIITVPLMNPDGIFHGHWRHNMHGVDLNRDWGPFTQPETQALKHVLDAIAADPQSELRVLIDFHSTSRNLFYIQTEDEPTIPANVTRDWLDTADKTLQGYDYTREPAALSPNPVSKNYAYRRFGAPSIVFEVGDNTDRAAITDAAGVFADALMGTLLASDPDLADKQPGNSKR